MLDVDDWIRYNKLKLNPDKMFYCLVLLFGADLQRKTIMHDCPAKSFFHEITPPDIGVIFMSVQVTYQICRSILAIVTTIPFGTYVAFAGP